MLCCVVCVYRGVDILRELKDIIMCVCVGRRGYTEGI
jgi:hypothetical protein